MCHVFFWAKYTYKVYHVSFIIQWCRWKHFLFDVQIIKYILNHCRLKYRHNYSQCYENRLIFIFVENDIEIDITKVVRISWFWPISIFDPQKSYAHYVGLVDIYSDRPKQPMIPTESILFLLLILISWY